MTDKTAKKRDWHSWLLLAMGIAIVVRLYGPIVSAHLHHALMEYVNNGY